MNKLPPIDSDLEKLLRDSLESGTLPCSSDSAFLQSLNQRLKTIPGVQAHATAAQEARSKPQPAWRAGVFNGITGVAVGLILLLGLNVLPGFLVRISIAGTDLAEEKIITLSIQQQVVWNQFVVNLENQTRFYLQK